MNFSTPNTLNHYKKYAFGETSTFLVHFGNLTFQSLFAFAKNHCQGLPVSEMVRYKDKCKFAVKLLFRWNKLNNYQKTK